MQALLYQKTQHSQAQQYSQHVDTSVSLQDHQEGQEQKEIGGEVLVYSCIERKTRYSTKMTPEERRRQKLNSFVDSDDSEDDSSEEQPPKAKKAKTLREVSYDAQISHKSMCESALSSLSLMN